ncbi:hypothetical protein V8C34DRAFT_306785 [Trichoderma compactum]
MKPLLKIFGRPFEKLRNKRGPSREGSIGGISNQEADVCASDNEVKLSTPDLHEANVSTRMEQHEDQNIPSITINEPGVEKDSTTEQNCSPAPDLEQTIATTVQPEIVQAPVTPPERIWNKAYDSLKAEAPKLVQEYEKILSFNLHGRADASLDLVQEKNAIEEDVSVRRAQMHQLINDGLKKIRREADMKENIGAVMQVVDTTKQLVGDAVKDIPQAALPWAIILTNPISETEANQSGVKYVRDTIKIEDLFFYETFVKLDDWDGGLKSIKVDDDSLRNRVIEFLDHKKESHLGVIARRFEVQDRYQRTQEDKQCLKDLFITDPRKDKKRIEGIKGGLFEDSYRWILENPEYQAWRSNDEKRLLRLGGDPGKGKTMLLCGLVRELKQQSASSLVTFFFCQASIESINNHTAVLRGLIWLLADQRPSLISYIRESYDTTGKNIFEGANAWYTLSDIFINMLRDEELPPVYIIIDALDECITGREGLLGLIQKISTLSKVKLLVSSRNRFEIEDTLAEGMSLSLEVNATLVAAAVELYITHKASQLSILKNDAQLQEEVCHQMRQKANGTFLWVSIVFERLNSESDVYYDDTSDIMAILNEMPDDLTKLYTVMLERTSHLTGKGPELCRAILAITTLAHRPLHLDELSNLAGFQKNLKKLSGLNKIIKDCGSFLTVRENYVYFIHQSAKEYLSSSASSQSVIFPNGMGKVGNDMVSNSLDAMKTTLQRNIYGLEYPGIPIDDVNPPNPNPLDPVLYSCTHWVAHLCEADTVRDDASLLYSPTDEKGVLHFLKQHFLHWLEALALTRNLWSNIVHMKNLHQSLKQRPANEALRKFVYDVGRFMQYHAGIIQKAPMQIYLSALQFSPEKSLVRTHFDGQSPSWVKPTISREAYWSPRLQTIEVTRPWEVTSRGTHLLILEEDSKNVSIWDMVSGKRVHILHHAETVRQAAFSSDPKHVLTVTWNQITLWDLDTGVVVHEVSISTNHIMVSNDGKLFAFIRERDFQVEVEVEIYAVSPKNLKLKPQTKSRRRPHYNEQEATRWSNNSKFLAVGDLGMDVFEVIECGLRKKMKIFNHYRGKGVGRFSFSHDSKLIAIVNTDVEAIDIWDLDKEEKTRTIHYEGSWWIATVEFSKDSTFIAAGLDLFELQGLDGSSSDAGFRHNLVHIWDVATGQKKHELQWRQKEHLSQLHENSICALAWSDDAKSLAVAFRQSGVEICDITEHSNWAFGTGLETPPYKVIFSPDFKLVTALTDEDSVSIWDTKTGSEIFTVDMTPEYTRKWHILRFFEDSKLIYIFDPLWNHFSVWDIAANKPLSSNICLVDRYQTTVFLLGGTYCATWPRLRGDEVKLWKLTADEMILQSTIHLEGWRISRLEVSNNAKYIVSLSHDNDIAIWHSATGRKIWEAKYSTQADESKNWSCKNCAAIYHDDMDGLYEHPSITVSNDGKTVLLTDHQCHEMWVISEEGSRVKLQICCRYLDPSFDIESPYILTEQGRINLNNLVTQAEKFVGDETAYDYQFITEGYGVSSDKAWITWNGRNVIWLPPGYQATTQWAISPDCIAIGTGAANKVNIFSFSGPPSF